MWSVIKRSNIIIEWDHLRLMLVASTGIFSSTGTHSLKGPFRREAERFFMSFCSCDFCKEHQQIFVDTKIENEEGTEEYEMENAEFEVFNIEVLWQGHGAEKDFEDYHTGSFTCATFSSLNFIHHSVSVERKNTFKIISELRYFNWILWLYVEQSEGSEEASVVSCAESNDGGRPLHHLKGLLRETRSLWQRIWYLGRWKSRTIIQGELTTSGSHTIAIASRGKK